MNKIHVFITVVIITILLLLSSVESFETNQVQYSLKTTHRFFKNIILAGFKLGRSNNIIFQIHSFWRKEVNYFQLLYMYRCKCIKINCVNCSVGKFVCHLQVVSTRNEVALDFFFFGKQFNDVSYYEKLGAVISVYLLDLSKL